jgi:hypothetical protein
MIAGEHKAELCSLSSQERRDKNIFSSRFRTERRVYTPPCSCGEEESMVNVREYARSRRRQRVCACYTREQRKEYMLADKEKGMLIAPQTREERISSLSSQREKRAHPRCPRKERTVDSPFAPAERSEYSICSLSREESICSLRLRMNARFARDERTVDSPFAPAERSEYRLCSLCSRREYMLAAFAKKER